MYTIVVMTSILREFFTKAQTYSDLMEDTEWGTKSWNRVEEVARSSQDAYSDLLEDSEWN
tara:strand:- start:297 stop:476 length:180 start_codon:yes stop_codon:yes gene_type:complete